MFRVSGRSWFPIVLPVLLALAACSGVSADWVKPKASEARVRADNKACRQEAEAAYGTTANITRDIQAARPRSLNDVGDRSERIRNNNTQVNYDKIFDVCMAGRGYKRASNVSDDFR